MRRTPFCKQARATGTCNTEVCKDRHDVARCMPCGRFIPSPQMEAHAQGPTHIRNAAKLPEPTPPPTSGHGQRPESSGGVRNAHVDEPRAASPSGAPSLRVLTILIARCDICSVYLDVADSETHAAGRRHRELATRRAAGLPSPAPAPDLKHCDTCNDDFPSSAFKSHVRSRNHLSTQKFTDLARDALVDEGPTDRAPRASSARSGSNAEGASDRAERRETADGGRAGDPPMVPSLIAGLPKVLSTGRLCDLCCVYTSKDGFEDHITGKQHQEARERKLSGARTPAPPPRAIYCRACNHHYHPNRHERHISHSQHINRQRWLDEALEKVETVGQATSQPSLHGDERYVADDDTPSEDTSRTEPLPEIDPGKIGLSVSCAEGVDFGVLEEHNDGQEWTSSMKTTTITLDKHTRDLPVSFVRAQIYSRAEVEDSLPYFSASLHGDSPWIKRGHQRIVVVAFTPHYEGLFEGTLELVFYHGDLKREFSVFRTLKGVAGSIQDRIYRASPEPTATGPTLAGNKKPYVAPSTYISLMPPPRSRGKRSRRLPQYEPPNAIVDAMQSPEYDQVLTPALVAEMLPGTLSMETYQQWFETFVWIEEGQNYRQLEELPPWEVNVIHSGDRHRIVITETSEERLPEVSFGDSVYLDDARLDVRYECRIQDVDCRDIDDERTQITLELRVPAAFRAYNQQTFVLRLKLNRIPLRRRHHALNTPVNRARRFLFPAAHDVRPLVGGYEDVKRELRLVNPLLETDERQLETVVSILRQAPGSVPFIVYGPPGTGKTVTIVEAILQLLRADTSRNILVCAPSNVATDVLTERLAGGGLTTADMLRLNAFSREIGTDCSDAVKAFTHAGADADDVYAVPPLAQLVRYRVVLCTCSSASLLQTSGVPRGHFSHVFVDEAVYADEPTCVIPIKAVADEFTQIVLAGDPNQLQPVVMSNTAGKGLKRSYLQRLMSMKDIYGLPQQHGQTIVKLVRNRRSHPRIIAWSNKMFYEDELRAHADPVVVRSLLGSTLLPNTKFPVVFHGIKGEEKRSVSSSVFNVEEASLVKKYCKTLTEGPEHRVLAKDIGVVAPYKAQARRIRRLLKNARLKDVVVGSVEQFQGQERKVIIISTSRSSVDKEDAKAVEAKKSIGFIGEGRRMNVAFTRAKSMLVVIGDPNALGVSPLWRFFLNFVHRNGGCKGRPLGWKADEGVKLPDYVKEDVPLDQRAHGEEFMGGVRSYILRQRPPAR